MRLYYEIAVRSFRRASTYRIAYISSILTNAFFGAVRCFIFIAAYRASNVGATGQPAGFSLTDAISYTWLAQAMISLEAGWVTSSIASTIWTGEVITDLSRPWSFYGYWLSRAFGERGFNLLIRGPLTYLVGVLYFAARVPSWPQLMAFAVAALLALVISFAFGFLVNLSAFWLVDSSGVFVIATTVLALFSGFALPLAFFPPWLATIARWLPFQAITNLPAELFLGRIVGWAVWQVFAIQLFWLAVLVGGGLVALRAAVRKVVVQGG